MSWSQKEIDILIDILIDLYPNNDNKYISEILGKSKYSIFAKARRLKLSKSKEHNAKIRKDRTRDLSYEFLLSLAKNYKTRSDFQKDDSSAYSAARVMGVTDDICSHMIPQNVSRPQLILKFIIQNIFKEKILYNTKSIIKPYELDIYLPDIKLAFEYDGSYWHKNKKNIDIIKNKLCKDKGIKLIRIKEKSRNYISDIKDSLNNNLNKINKFCKTAINISDINDISDNKILSFISKSILDYDSIIEITNKYNDYKEFMKKENRLYCKLIELNCLEKFTKHMHKDIIYWNYDLCIEELNKYNTYKEFIKGDSNYSAKTNKCYIHIKRNNLLHLLDKFDDKPIKYTDEYINNIVCNYITLEELKSNHMNLYSSLVHTKTLYMIKHLKRKHNRHNLSEIYEHDYSKYKNINHFENEQHALYLYACRQNLLYFIKNKILEYNLDLFINI
jgi:very-short-patch-repair endonuclease